MFDFISQNGERNVSPLALWTNITKQKSWWHRFIVQFWSTLPYLTGQKSASFKSLFLKSRSQLVTFESSTIPKQGHQLLVQLLERSYVIVSRHHMSTLPVNTLILCIWTTSSTATQRSAKIYTWMPAKQAVKATSSRQKVRSNWRGFLTFLEEISRVRQWTMIQFYVWVTD